MRSYEIAIVEDTDLDAELLQQCLTKYAQKHDIELIIKRYPSGEAFLADHRRYFDLVFMDMRLSGMDGFKTSRCFRESNRVSELIFITSIEQYAIKGYEVDANDFILKPVTYAVLESKFRKALLRIQAADETVPIRVSTKERVHLIPARNIYYVEVIKHDVIYHTMDGDITAYGSLSKVEAELAEAGFARSCSWCLVNLKYVEGLYDEEIRLYNGQSLHISRSKRKSFLQKLASYCTTGR